MSTSNNLDEITTWLSADLTEESPLNPEEISFIKLRPTAFDNYIGQDKTKENLQIACQAAKNRSEPLDHVLLYGPPGLGKTSLARIVSNQLGTNFKSTSGPVIERPGDLAAMLTSLEANSVLFIDEIHRLPRVVEEVLYPAMEDFEIDILIGQGPAAKSVKIPLKPFTLIGATTRSGMLTSPLRDRFGITARLEFYSPMELQQIVLRSADLLSISIENQAALEIGQRSRGTPRIANKILKRVRDFAQEKGTGVIDRDAVQGAMSLLEIDQLGLTQMDRSLLKIIIENFKGGPVGLETLAVGLSEERETIEDVYEPFLIQAGLLARTPRGRVVTEEAYLHLGLSIKPNDNLKLL